MCAESSVGGMVPPTASQQLVASAIRGSGVAEYLSGRRDDTRTPEAEDEARNADGAKQEALLIPKPPHLTGSTACSRSTGAGLTFKQRVIGLSTSLSNWTVRLERKHGDVRRVNISLGIARLFFKRNSAS